MTEVRDAVVVGGGIVGSLAALALARRGLSVALVDKGRLGGGTSAWSFAWVNASSKVADPDYFRLNAEGLAGWRTLAAEFGAEALGFHGDGALLVAPHSDASGRAALLARKSQLDALGYEVGQLDGEALEEFEPAVAFAPDTEALFLPAEGWVDIARAIASAAGELRRLGGTVHEDCAATALEADEEGRVAGVETARGRISTRSVVLATGIDTGAVLARLTGFEAFATRFPVHRVPGLLLRVPPDPGVAPPRRILWWLSEGELHLRPDAGGRLMLGSEATDGLIDEEASPDERLRAAARLLARAREVVPGIDSRAALERARIGIGVRAVPADGRSIAGPLPGAEGLHLAVTHSGVTLAPVLGALLAEAITAGSPPAMLSPFLPDRLPGFR